MKSWESSHSCPPQITLMSQKVPSQLRKSHGVCPQMRQGGEDTDVGRGLERDPCPMCGATMCWCERLWQDRQSAGAQVQGR